MESVYRIMTAWIMTAWIMTAWKAFTGIIHNIGKKTQDMK
jgi:hypothetical protein